jgi:hypothetical protein
MTEKEQIQQDLNKLDKLLQLSKDYINNQQLELELDVKNKTEEVFNDINRYTSYKIPNSYSGNNILYHQYVRKFVTKRCQQIFNSPKVVIYAQVPLKLQGVMYTFNKGKYKKAVKHLFDRITSNSADY